MPQVTVRETQRGRPVARLVPVATEERPRWLSTADRRALMPQQEVTSEQLVREDRHARA